MLNRPSRARSIEPGDRVRLDFPGSGLHGSVGQVNLTWGDQVGATWQTELWGRVYAAFDRSRIRRMRRPS